ncbi:MAG: phosphoesterase, partial [Chloroflexi bacterium]|nr:phosphoesterase [Chloroflexota bacterium]
MQVAQSQEPPSHSTIPLPTSRNLTVPVPGFIARTNSFPATLVVSPDGRYAALLNQGFGTEDSGVRQSIGILDLIDNRLSDFPDDRLADHKKQSYFIGLAFSTDGAHLYASMASVSDSGIAVYSFLEGRVRPERYIPIAAATLARGKTLAYQAEKTASGKAPSYPAGLAVVPSPNGDRLLVADNLADRVLLMDAASGQILRRIDLSRSRYVPTAYPYTVIANRSGTRAWVSLWNDSAVAELDLLKGKVVRRIVLWRPAHAFAPGTHPTALVLSRSEHVLYVALANAGNAAIDGVAA